MISIKRFEFNPFGENTYVIWDTATLQAAVIDPGMASSAEEQMVSSLISDNKLELKAILLTHIHIDHTFGVEFLKQSYPEAIIYANQGDDFLGQRRMEQARMFHLPMELKPLKIDRFIGEGEILKLGDSAVMALHAPGHSPGSLLYYIPSEAVLFTGDVIFQRSIGRTDLPGGNHGQLIASIHNKILDLPASTIIYPGHGPATTIGEELRFNPYF